MVSKSAVDQRDHGQVEKTRLCTKQEVVNKNQDGLDGVHAHKLLEEADEQVCIDRSLLSSTR